MFSKMGGSWLSLFLADEGIVVKIANLIVGSVLHSSVIFHAPCNLNLHEKCNLV